MNKMKSFQRPRAGPLLCCLVVLAMCGCDDDGESDRTERRRLQERLRQAQEQSEQQRQQLEESQREREQDRRVLAARKDEAESDTGAAVMAWGATGIALAVVIALLARERHLRSILEHLVRMFLGADKQGKKGRPP